MTEERTERKSYYKRREDYVPMMIKVSGFDGDLDAFKKLIPNRVSVGESGKDYCLFTSSKYWLEEVKTLCPDAKIDTVESDQVAYKDGLKIEAALNWRKFKNMNKEYSDNTDNEVFIIVRSTAYESREPEIAVEYTKHVISQVYDTTKKELVAIIRPWLIETFKDLRASEEFVDKNGKHVEKMVYYINRSEMRRPADKAIVLKFYSTIKEVPAFIESLQEMERFPQVQFLNPTTMEDKPRRRTQRDRAGQRNDRSQKRRQEREDGEERRPRVEGEQKEVRQERPRGAYNGDRTERPVRTYEDRPRPARTEEDRPRQTRDEEDRPRPRQERQLSDNKPAYEKRTDGAERPRGPFVPHAKRDVIEIADAVATTTFTLEHIPDTMEPVQLLRSLRQAVGQDLKVKKQDDFVICTISEEYADKLAGVLDRLKINGVQITYTKK